MLLDADLAAIYGVPTKALNQAVKRNAERFPEDFCFQLSTGEWNDLNRSQIVTGSQKHRDPRFLPRVFTEHGALMAANVLNSPDAVRMSVHVVRAFIKQRELIAGQAEILKKLAQIDATLLEHDEACASSGGNSSPCSPRRRSRKNRKSVSMSGSLARNTPSNPVGRPNDDRGRESGRATT